MATELTSSPLDYEDFPVKLPLEDEELGHTVQNAFQKFKQAVETIRHKNDSSPNLPLDVITTEGHQPVTLHSRLEEIFPRKTRKREIRAIEFSVGVKLQALRSRRSVSFPLTIFSIVSMIAMFIGEEWEFAFAASFLSILLNILADRTGIEFRDETVGDLVRKITIYRYLRSGKNEKKLKMKEIEEQIRLLMSDPEFSA